MSKSRGRSTAAEAYHRWYHLAAWKGPRGRRATQLAAEPVCRFCELAGRTTLATVADHVQPHRGDPDLFWHGELQSLCAPCHDGRKQGEENRGYSLACDADGWPIDRNHPTNRRK